MDRLFRRFGELRKCPNEQQDFVRRAKGSSQGLELGDVVAAREKDHHRVRVPGATEQCSPRSPVADDHARGPVFGEERAQAGSNGLWLLGLGVPLGRHRLPVGIGRPLRGS
eukprot:1880211-Alexandrium_andersonii.AAC.1